MQSNKLRCIYKRNQLANVICQLRFPDILSINHEEPAMFQEAIREAFPIYAMQSEQHPPRITGAPGNLKIETPPATINYQFSSVDGIWKINLTKNFISLTCAKYKCWEDFANKLDSPLAAFINIYKPACFQRIGLRYINIISKEALDLSHLPFRDMIAQEYTGILAFESVDESAINRCNFDTEIGLSGGCAAKIHAGTGRVSHNGIVDKEVKFIFDLDLFMSGNIPVNYSAGALRALHAQAYPIFRGAITEQLHEAMEPQFV